MVTVRTYKQWHDHHNQHTASRAVNLNQARKMVTQKIVLAERLSTVCMLRLCWPGVLRALSVSAACVSSHQGPPGGGGPPGTPIMPSPAGTLHNIALQCTRVCECTCACALWRMGLVRSAGRCVFQLLCLGKVFVIIMLVLMVLSVHCNGCVCSCCYIDCRILCVCK